MPKTAMPAGVGRTLAAALMLAAFAGTAGAGAPAAQRWRCTNPASGAGWTIVVDAAGGRVDHFPATIGGRRIDWRDPARGMFELDRATGALQLRNASSTGGYFLHYRCRRQ